MTGSEHEATDRHPRGPEENRAAARALGYRGANSILVLSANNDPFYKGTPAHWTDAEWFRALWDAFGYTTGVHLRRSHYQVLSTEQQLPNGTPYENTEQHWSRLCTSGSAARILGLVDVEAFEDRRNDPPIINRRPSPPRGLLVPRIGFRAEPWQVPELDLRALVDAVTISMPTPYPAGYEYEFDDDHPTLVEVWVEKSTMNDILVPLCEAEGVNLAVAKGFESITHAVELVRRAEQLGRDAHIIYISDFDPGGEGMPIAVARQLQFWLDELKVDQRITLEPVALTREQCIEFELPRTPIKEGDQRARGFQARHGEGATELDALEALHPGELARIVRGAIRRHVDTGYRQRLIGAASSAGRLVAEAWAQADGTELQAEADRFTDEARQAMAGLGEEINALIAERINELEPLRQAADELVRRAEQVAAGLRVELPERPTVEIAGPSDDVLFDSDRHWVDQLNVFRAPKAVEDGGE
jgi:hypothetical protein